MTKIVSPSLLAIDFAQLPSQLKKVEVAGATWLHYDVMDGVFVDNISFGPGILKQIHRITDCYLDVHLMIQSPRKYFDSFIDAGANSITFHVEAMESAEATLEAIKYLKQKGVHVGITLKPTTDLDQIVSYLKLVDLVLVMSVNPGFGGQAFIPEMLERIKHLSEIRSLNGYQYLISVDGGINDETGKRCRSKGADVLVAGSYIFKEDIEKAVVSLL